MEHASAMDKAVENGLLAIALVFAFNFLILLFLKFPSMAFIQIQRYWLLLVVLIAGFGFQIGLATYVHYRNIASSSMAAASGSVSSVSMVICCSHYLAVLLPFLSFTFSFLTKYTPYILLFGVFSNFVGILYLLRKAQVHFKLRATWLLQFIIAMVLLFTVSSAFANYSFHASDAQELEMEGSSDSCIAPPGYTQQQWDEHMGHHPDQYAKCLNKVN